MAGKGNLDFRNSARLINLPDPISPNEPALARDVVIYPLSGGKVFSNQLSTNALTTVSVTANFARCSLIEIRRDCVISAALTDVATAVAGSFYRTAIYSLNSSLYPTTLLWDGGIDHSGATVGVKSDSLGGNKTVKAGVYINVIKSSVNLTMRAIPQASNSVLLGHVNAAGLATITGFTVPLTWVANTPFPATFPTLTPTNLTNAAQPIYCYVAV